LPLAVQQRLAAEAPGGQVERCDLQETPEDILTFWFADAVGDPAKAMQRQSFWFQADAAVDESISQRFSASVRFAARGEFTAWEHAPQSCLALVILLDQFPRNLYRGRPEAFQYDSRALDVASQGVAAGYLAQLSSIEQCIFVLPYEHSEAVSVQRAGIELFEQIVDGANPEWEPSARVSLHFARKHLEIVERFGRFPHRNAVLGRPSTAAERAYLEGGGESFGQ
jgi:uncharacterized protein (DUF924 family)